MRLILVYTLKCNASCKICCFNCDPHQKAKMKLQEALDYIKQAAGNKAIHEISITGGEALLYKNEVEELIALSHSYHFKTYLTTNAFWANSIENARQVLSELKIIGLSELVISTDEFHASYIPYQNIENLIIANEKVKLPLAFQSVITKKTSTEHPLENKYPEYTWKKGICQPVGRALQTIPWEEYIYNGYDGKCVYANTLTIMPDGSTYPCCSQGLRLEKLKIGSAQEQTLEALIKAKKQHEFLNVITNIGAKLIKQKGEEKGYYLSRSQEDYVSICHLCHEIGTDQVYLDKMDHLIKETAGLINYSKLLSNK